MTLYQLSAEYGAGAQALKERIALLRQVRSQTEDQSDRLVLEDRIRTLSSMWRDTRDVAVLTAHYYERGYRRNAKYIL